MRTESEVSLLSIKTSSKNMLSTVSVESIFSKRLAMLEFGERYNYLDKKWMLLCAENNTDDVKNFLQNYPEYTNFKDPLWTILHWAVKASNLELVKSLLYLGTDINTIDGRTPLHYAVIYRFKDIEDLLRATPDCDIKKADFNFNEPTQYFKSRKMSTLPPPVQHSSPKFSKWSKLRKAFSLRKVHKRKV